MSLWINVPLKELRVEKEKDVRVRRKLSLLCKIPFLQVRAAIFIGWKGRPSEETFPSFSDISFVFLISNFRSVYGNWITRRFLFTLSRLLVLSSWTLGGWNRRACLSRKREGEWKIDIKCFPNRLSMNANSVSSSWIRSSYSSVIIKFVPLGKAIRIISAL